MLSSDERRIHELIELARQATQSGRPQEATRLLLQAAREGPRHALVLNEAAQRVLRSGDPAGAHLLLQEVVKTAPSSPAVWFTLGGALCKLGRIDEAVAAFDRVLALEPTNLSALLEKASLEDLQGKPRAAAATYRTALQMIPPDFRIPPQMRAALERAKQAVDANNLALEQFIDEGLEHLRAQYPHERLGRFDKCVSTLLQKRRIYRQQPTFMYFPELPAIEFYEREDFPWLDSIEAATDDIRAELLNLLEDESKALEPYVADPQGLPVDQWRELNHSRRWGVFNLWREGVAFPENLARCPRTVEALEAWPRWDMPGSGPTALFSVLDAKTHIPAHTGPVNTRLVVHLPLIVPPGCKFRVGAEEREWRPGKAFVFDDSINHEAWNNSDVPRAVMILDTWSPYLSDAERELTRALTARVAEYYGPLSNSGRA
jgi:aspartate beta-hydroxylase